MYNYIHTHIYILYICEYIKCLALNTYYTIVYVEKMKNSKKLSSLHKKYLNFRSYFYTLHHIFIQIYIFFNLVIRKGKIISLLLVK